MMHKGLCAVLLLAAVGGVAVWGQPPAMSGSLGFEITFTSPLPNVASAVTLSLSVGRVHAVSRTEFSLTGFGAAHLAVGLSLDGVGLRSGLRFDPCFSQYWFDVRVGCCPWEFGGLFLVENLSGPCDLPAYTLGLVIDLGAAWRPGFFARSLTGFGVTGLYSLVDLDPSTQLTAVPGIWFEEGLLHLGFTNVCFLMDGMVLLNPYGLDWFELGASYLYPDPAAELGIRTRVQVQGGIALDWAKLFLGVRVPPVEVRLVTAFNLSGFLWQEVGVDLLFSSFRIYARTRFDFSGISEVRVGFEVAY